MIVLDGEEFLTVVEAARRLGVKPATLYAYVSRGVIRSYRQGIRRQRLYRRAEIDALLRLGPGPSRSRSMGRGTGRRPVAQTPDIPLAESWIRD